MAESIFTSQTPADANISDDTTYTLGTVWTPAADGVVTHLRMFAPTSAPSGSVIGVLYRVDSDTTGVELARATFGTLTLGDWNAVALPSPVPVFAGSYYAACYVTPDRFVITTAFFAAGSTVNGSLTAPQSGSPYGNGRFHVGDGFPDVTSGERSCYFADVVFEAGAPAAQGTADVGVGLSVGAAGGRGSAGVVVLELALVASVSGSAPEVGPAAGAAGVVVTLGVAGHGRAPGSGGGCFPYGETATVIRAGLSDDGYGNQVRDWTTAVRTPSPGWGFAPRHGDENTIAGSQGVIVGLTGYGPPGADVLPTDRMEVRGEVYEVVGEVGEWRNPFTGWEPGVEVALRRVYVAEG